MACRQLLARRQGRDAFAQAQIAAALGRSGETAQASRYLQELRAQYDAAKASERPNVAFFLAAAYAGLEQPEQVFPWLEVAARGKSSRLNYLRVDPRFAVVRADPRWSQILATYEARPRTLRKGRVTLPSHRRPSPAFPGALPCRRSRRSRCARSSRRSASC